MAQNYRTDRHLNPVALTTAVAKSLGWKQGVDYEVGDSFRTGTGSILHTARLKVPEGMSALEFTKKKFDESYNSGADVFYTKSGQPRWTHTAIKKEDWQKMDDNSKLATIAKMYKNEGGSGVLSKGVSYGKEPGMIERGLKTVSNFLLPTASADDGRGEPMYAGGFKSVDEVPMGSGGFIARKAPKIDYNDIAAVRSFVDENGGLDERDQQAFRMMTTRYGMTKEDAIREVAKKKAYFMENPEQTLEGLSYDTDEEQPVNNGGQTSSEIGRFGIPSQSIDWAGRPEVAPEALTAAKDSILNMEGGYEAFANQLKGLTREQKAAIPGDQRQAFLSILKDKYEKFTNAGPNGEATPEAQAAFAKWAKEAMYDLAPVHADAIDYQSQVFGYGASQDEKFQSDSIIADIANFGIDKLARMAKTANTLGNAVGINPFKMTAEAGQDLAEGVMEGNAFKAGSGIMKAVGVQQALSSPIGAAVTAGINQLAKTDAGSGLLKFALWAPSKGAEMLINAIPGIPEKQKADAIALTRDLLASAAVRGTIGGYQGAKAGAASSPAASGMSKLGSSLVGAGKGLLSEGAKGILDPFKVTIPSAKSAPSAASSKVITDAAERVKKAARNEKSISPTAKRIGEEGLVDAADGINRMKKLGVDISEKNKDNIGNEVASAKETVFENFNNEAKDVKVNFNKQQLKSGVENLLKKEMKGGIDDATQLAVDDIVNQVDQNLTRGGKAVADMSAVHRITSKLYDVIIKAADTKGVLRVNAPLVLLAVKEQLYKQLESVPGFAKYIDDYRNLSRVEDITKLMADKFGTDIMNKKFSETIPPSWTGIMAGAAGGGKYGIAASALLASFISMARQKKKSPTNLFNDVKKVADAIEAYGEGGADALRTKLGIEPNQRLGQNATDISQDFANLAGTANKAPVAQPVERPTGKAAWFDLPFDKTPAQAEQALKEAASGVKSKPAQPKVSPYNEVSPHKQFGGKDFYETINPVEKPVPAPVAKPVEKKVEAPKKPAATTSTVAKPAETKAPVKNVSTNTTDKKAPVAKKEASKASVPAKKATVAPKAVKTVKKATPAKAQSVEDYVKGVKLSEGVGAQLKEFVNNLKEYGIKEQSDAIAKVAKIGTKELAGLLKYAEPRTGLYKALSDALSAKLKK